MAKSERLSQHGRAKLLKSIKERAAALERDAEVTNDCTGEVRFYSVRVGTRRSRNSDDEEKEDSDDGNSNSNNHPSEGSDISTHMNVVRLAQLWCSCESRATGFVCKHLRAAAAVCGGLAM